MTPDSVITSSPFDTLTSINLTPVWIVLSVVFLLVAFFGFRFFKFGIAVVAASMGYNFGSATLGMLIADSVTAFNAPMVIGLICAVLFAVLAPIFCKASIYTIGGIVGFSVGTSIVENIFSAIDLEKLGGVIGVLVGLVLVVPFAKLIYGIFKPYLITVTSFMGCIFAAYCVLFAICGSNSDRMVSLMPIFMIVGLILAVVAMVIQFLMNRERSLDL